MADPCSACFTAERAVKGGATATCAAAPSSFCRSSRMSCTASPAVLCIFQLPQTNLRLERMSSPRTEPGARIIEHLDSRQLAPLEELQRGAAAGVDVRHIVGHAHLGDGRRAVAA